METSSSTPGPVSGPPSAQSGPAPDDLLVVIDQAVEAVRDIANRPLVEHGEQYEAVHATLQDALSDTDRPDTR